MIIWHHNNSIFGPRTVSTSTIYMQEGKNVRIKKETKTKFNLNHGEIGS